MPPKKIIKTPYSKTNPVDIASLLTNSNLVANITPLLNQTGGKRTNIKEPIIQKKSKKEDDDISESESESDTDSQYGKGKDNDGEVEEEEEEEGEEDEIEAIPVVDEIEDEEGNDEEDNVNDMKSEASDDDDNDDDKETVDVNNKCYSKYAKNNDLDLDEYFKDDDIIITKAGRVGKPILFKYEKVRLLCDRSRQLAEGAKPMIKNTAGLSHKEIALLELKNKLIPLIIERPIPNAGSERWRLSELEIPEYD
jgi:DNA-directed RNA polymerase subunit K/omega